MSPSPPYARVRVRLAGGSIASQWRPIEVAHRKMTWTFDPTDFRIPGLATAREEELMQVWVDVQLTEDPTHAP